MDLSTVSPEQKDALEKKLLETREVQEKAMKEQKEGQEKELKEARELHDKELSAREKAMADQEDELTELRSAVKGFPKELEKAVSTTRKEAISLTEKDAKHKTALMTKEIEGERKVYEMKIKTLEETIKKQNSQLDSMTKQLNDSFKHVQNIASKAIIHCRLKC